jgi:hypothetical protein
MKTRLIISLLFFCVSSVFANDSADSLKKKRFSWSIQPMLFSRNTGFEKKLGTINPDNRIAQIHKSDGGLYVRPDFKYEYDNFTFWAKPRFHADFPPNYTPRGKESWHGDYYSAEFFFQDLKARWQINDKMFVQGGRYLKQIGTSIFLNPSNPFIANTGRLNPKIELIPMDFVEFNFVSKSEWNYTLIANLGAAQTPIYKAPFFDFKRKYGLLIEHYGTSDNVSLNIAVDEDQKYHLGGYGQRNLNEGLVVWTDFAIDYKINRFYPVIGNSTKLIDYEMVNGSENDKVFLTGLVGASYTFTWGPTLQMEYYYNGKGFSKSEFQTYKDMIVDSESYNFDARRRLGDLNLGRSLNTGMQYLRQNYVFTQFGQNDLFGKLNVNFRNLYCADDNTDQLSTLVELEASDHLELFCLGLKNFGAKETDLKKLIDYQIMVGLIAKF